ncbi:polyphosphate:AMP phosphotransferase [Denitratisoma sp. agr-D3]
MFESAELGHKIDKAAFRKEEPGLRADLLDVQYDLKEAGRFPVVILINGLDGAGKGEMVNLLNAWMDPRHIETHAFPPPAEEERLRPPMWRFWRALPPKGKIGIFVGNWYTDPIVSKVRGASGKADLERSVNDILRLEKLLTDEGVLVLKYWFHLSKKGQKNRLEKLAANPKTRWRVSRHDWDLFAQYDKYVKTARHVLRLTSSGQAPWIVVDGSDEYYRAITVGRHLRDAIRARLKLKDGKTARISAAPLTHALDGRDLINALDLGQKLAKKRYETDLEQWQAKLNALARHPRFKKRSLVMVFEGNDAAGKGGTIRRVTAALDARNYTIVPIAAPTEEERAQPYMWRFWRHVPQQGRMTIFDRSWYGRVLVERVEGFCTEADWMRAYAEINDFEEQLSRNGAIVLKFWLAISKDEQYRRFKEREKTRFKRFKITEEDWRNRDKWDDYETAVCDMVDRTSTGHAPWTLVEANDKNFARIKVLRTLCERLENELKKG